ncbi:hypothetical protein FEM48_Zijuj10G0064500 [Ziziphus jujuba var. spinosa]|uniref:Reverse transcriptase domain-containing protein n=1 Tax=Ziziphus jujuba var. spinosa TaxID=714518 RepID=A0A978ULU5_ZIZJJ|nr:hypothetical protein FEM48_Zijuj10G0064500 [Ziziphus jujuba var. spinosa]
MEIDIMSKCAGTAFPSKVSYMEDEDEDANAGLSLVVTTIQKGNEIMGIDSVLGVDSHPSTTALVDLLPIQMCEHGVNPLLADDAVQIEGANIKKAHMELVSIAQTHMELLLVAMDSQQVSFDVSFNGNLHIDLIAALENDHLLELDLHNIKYTWARKGVRSNVQSKIDRAFSSTAFLDFWDSISLPSLPQHNSYHVSIVVVMENSSNYGLIPFQFQGIIPCLVTAEENHNLTRMSSYEDIKEVAFYLDPMSAPGHNVEGSINAASDCINLKNTKCFGGNVAMKIDIKKAFDTLRWSFIFEVLKAFGVFSLVL